jgi:hypothetical protein
MPDDWLTDVTPSLVRDMVRVLTPIDTVPTFSWLGWDDAGTIERLGPEAIVTSFWWAVLPVRAGKSFYRYSDGRFEIPRCRRSVVLGYLRTPLWLAATIVAAPVLFASDRWELLPIGLALAAIAAVLTFAVGRLPRGERERRELLRRVAGIGAPPELMPAPMRAQLRDDLADAWWREYHVGWREAIHAGTASEVLVALAEYYQSPQLLIRARTNLIERGGN